MSDYITNDDREFVQRLAERTNFEASWDSGNTGQQPPTTTNEE